MKNRASVSHAVQECLNPRPGELVMSVARLGLHCYKFYSHKSI